MSDLDIARTRPPLPARAGRLRVAVVAESLGPDDALTGHVCRTLAHLHRRGHDAVLICPGPAPAGLAGAPVVTVPAFRFRGARLGLPSPLVMRTLASFGPDVVHLAGPVLLGVAALTAARQLDVPSVVVTRPGPGSGAFGGRAWTRRVHAAADLTLAGDEPDTAASPPAARARAERRGDDLIEHYRAVIARHSPA